MKSRLIAYFGIDTLTFFKKTDQEEHILIRDFSINNSEYTLKNLWSESIRVNQYIEQFVCTIGKAWFELKKS